jgi:hypothetical protein
MYVHIFKYDSFIHTRNLYMNVHINKHICTYTYMTCIYTVLFRGTATGGGVTIQNNQRLHIAQISYEWSLHKNKHLRGRINEIINEKSSKQQPKAKSTVSKKRKSVDNDESNDNDVVNDHDNEDNGDNDNDENNDDQKIDDENHENEIKIKNENTIKNENEIKKELKNKDDTYYPYLDAKITG